MRVYEDSSGVPEGEDELRYKLKEISKQYSVNAEISPLQAWMGYYVCLAYKALYYSRFYVTVALLLGCLPVTYYLVSSMTGSVVLGLLSAPFSIVTPFVYWVFVDALLKTMVEYIFFFTDRIPQVDLEGTDYDRFGELEEPDLKSEEEV